MKKYNEEILKYLLELDEWERKQIAMFLIGSTLNPDPQKDVLKLLKKLDR
tara:strand:- start:50 stop:199 length:150 start_codon:yes stop_codon:yes gene_type:complete